MAAINEISELLECAICLQNMENPKELVCRHMFCKSCLDEIIKFDQHGEGRIICPQRCREETIVGRTQTTNDLFSSFYIRNILEKLEGKR